MQGTPLSDWEHRYGVDAKQTAFAVGGGRGVLRRDVRGKRKGGRKWEETLNGARLAKGQTPPGERSKPSPSWLLEKGGSEAARKNKRWISKSKKPSLHKAEVKYVGGLTCLCVRCRRRNRYRRRRALNRTHERPPHPRCHQLPYLRNVPLL